MKSICYDSKYGAPCNCEKVIRCRFFHLLIPCFHLSLTRCLLWAVLHYITIPGPPKSIFWPANQMPVKVMTTWNQLVH